MIPPGTARCIFSSQNLKFLTFKVYKALFDNECGNKIKVLRTKNGNEYVNKDFWQLCEEWCCIAQE